MLRHHASALRACLVALLGLVPASGLTVVAASSYLQRQPVYSIAAVEAHLTSNPRTWVGRWVLVYGVLSDCGPLDAEPAYCLAPDPADVAPAPAVEPLPVAWARPDPLLVVLRRVPFLSHFVGEPQALRWDRPAAYQVQLRQQTLVYCGAGACYEAVLLNAARDDVDG